VNGFEVRNAPHSPDSRVYISVAEAITASSAARASSVTFDWSDLYERHAEELLRYLAKFLGDRERASELMQDTFVRALRRDDSIVDPRAVRGWLFQTATHLALNERRRRSLRRFIPFDGRERSPQEAFDPTAAQVHTALGSISAKEAAVLLLRYHSGFSRVEIASLLGLSEETVKSRLARGRKNFTAAYGRLNRGLAR
jgi:RNA polymerase sigma-70 factor (ECF subfamily)